MSKFPFRGAVLNAVSVAVGATIGLVLRTLLDASLLGVVLTGMGLFTMALAVKMFAETKNVLRLGITHRQENRLLIPGRRR